MDKVENNDNQRFRTFPLSMDKVGSKEEALLLVESYEAFIDIKERPNVGIWYISFSFVFIIFIPIILLQVFPLGMWGDSDGTELCCGSLLFGVAMFFGGLIQTSSHGGSYNKAAQDLAHAVCHYFYSNETSIKTVEEINYTGFAMLGDGNEGGINKMDWIYLARYFYPKENSNKTKSRKMGFSERERNDSQ
jgi:hypothetical protein